jgi:hypothetical protein
MYCAKSKRLLLVPMIYALETSRAHGHTCASPNFLLRFHRHFNLCFEFAVNASSLLISCIKTKNMSSTSTSCCSRPVQSKPRQISLVLSIIKTSASIEMYSNHTDVLTKLLLATGDSHSLLIRFPGFLRIGLSSMRKPFEEAPETAMRLYKSQDFEQDRLNTCLIVDFSTVQQKTVQS